MAAERPVTQVDLRGEVAIVTGAGRGVGRAIAEALASAGAAVTLAARSSAELETVAREIESAGGRALAVPTDVTDERAVAALTAATESTFAGPTLLVNGAGSWRQVGPVADADADVWWRDVEVNLKGTFLCSRAVLPSMLSRGRGRIVDVSSYAALAPRPFLTAYASSKAAVVRFTDSLAAELEGTGVLAFVITPGFVRTQMTEEVASSEAAQRYLPEFVRRGDDLSPAQAGHLVVRIASGTLDGLAGRFLHVLDDVEDLLRRRREIEERDLYTLRLRT